MNDARMIERGTGGIMKCYIVLLTHLLNLGRWHWQVRASDAVSAEAGMRPGQTVRFRPNR